VDGVEVDAILSDLANGRVDLKGANLRLGLSDQAKTAYSHLKFFKFIDGQLVTCPDPTLLDERDTALPFEPPHRRPLLK